LGRGTRREARDRYPDLRQQPSIPRGIRRGSRSARLRPRAASRRCLLLLPPSARSMAAHAPRASGSVRGRRGTRDPGVSGLPAGAPRGRPRVREAQARACATAQRGDLRLASGVRGRQDGIRHPDHRASARGGPSAGAVSGMGGAMTTRTMLALMLGLAAIAVAADYEKPPILPAKDIVPPAILAGKGYKIDDKVPTDGLLGRYTIRSAAGTFPAHGLEMLAVRVPELAAIQHLKGVSRNKVFLNSA